MKEESWTQALRLMGSTVVVDIHSHFMIHGYYLRRDFGKRHKTPYFWNPLRNAIDLPRLREGRVSCNTFSIYVPPFPLSLSPWSTCHKMLDRLDQLVRKNDQEVVKVDCARDIRAAQRQGLVAVLPAIEGAHVIGNHLDRVSTLRQRGVRILTLTHFLPNRIADSSLWPVHGGLSSVGKSLLLACQDSGVVVDLAHCSDAAFDNSLNLLTKPPMITHTALRQGRDSQRFVSRDQVRQIAQSGGAIGIILFPWYLKKHSILGGLDLVVDSYCRIADLVGTKHLMIGSDMDAFTWLPKPLCSTSDMPLLCAALLERGFSESEMRDILGGNVLRILQAWES